MLEINLFGAGQARYGDQPLVGFPNQQIYMLLCYLLLNRHDPLCRERLAAVFWEDYPAADSRKHLSKALWRLRQALQAAGVPADDYLLSSKEHVSFINSPAYQLDIEVFDTVLGQYQDIPGTELTAAQAAQLEQAVGLYRGDLLTGLYEDWLVYERERLSVLHLKGLSKLMDFHQANQAYERALSFGQTLLSYDQAHEKTHQRMMRLYWLMGDRSTALAQYKRCRQILRHETGFPPSAETKYLYQQMARNQFDPTAERGQGHGRLPVENLSEEALQELTITALRKLSRLHKIVEETTAELHHLEDLLTLTLVRSK